MLRDDVEYYELGGNHFQRRADPTRLTLDLVAHLNVSETAVGYAASSRSSVGLPGGTMPTAGPGSSRDDSLGVTATVTLPESQMSRYANPPGTP